MKSPEMKSKDQQAERRTSARKEVLEQFHVFVVVPSRGSRKIYLKDVSEGGMALRPEPSDTFTSGEVLDCHFYINANLKMPLSIKVVHATPQTVGCELTDRAGKGSKAYSLFLRLLDELAQFVE